MRTKKKIGYSLTAALTMSAFGLSMAESLPFWKEGTVPVTTRTATAVARKTIGYFSSHDCSSAVLPVESFISTKFGQCIILR